MVEEADSLVLRYLRRLDEKVDRVIADLGELKSRVNALEQQYAVVASRLDRLDLRVERIERRLELVEPVR